MFRVNDMCMWLMCACVRRVNVCVACKGVCCMFVTCVCGWRVYVCDVCVWCVYVACKGVACVCGACIFLSGTIGLDT